MIRPSRIVAALVALLLPMGDAFTQLEPTETPEPSVVRKPRQRTSEVPSPEAQELYNVGTTYDESGATSSALAVYRQIIKNYPFSPEAPKSQFRIAEIQRETGELNRAFDSYQLLLNRYPNSRDFDAAVSAQIKIANEFLRGRKIKFLGIPILNSIERTQEMYTTIINNAPYSKQAPIAQFNLGLAFEKQGKIKEAVASYQSVLDRYQFSDACDDALYQIGYVNMRVGQSGRSQDLSALVLAKETFEDFLVEYPKSEKAAQARDNLLEIGNRESGDLFQIARFYDNARDYRAAVIYYSDVIRKQPKTEGARLAEARVNEIRSTIGEEALRTGPEKAETGEKVALRRRLQAEVESSAMSDYAGPPRRDIVPDELPAPKPQLRTNIRDVQPLPPVEPGLPTP